MLSGHAFSRALRAHILTSAALIGVLMDTSNTLDKMNKDLLENLYKALLNHERNATDVAEKECVKQLSHVILQLLDRAASESRTVKLWVQYIRQVALLLRFILAERTGDWKLDLYCEGNDSSFSCCRASSLRQICQVVLATDGSARENYAGGRVQTVYKEEIFHHPTT